MSVDCSRRTNDRNSDKGEVGSSSPRLFQRLTGCCPKNLPPQTQPTRYCTVFVLTASAIRYPPCFAKKKPRVVQFRGLSKITLSLLYAQATRVILSGFSTSSYTEKTKRKGHCSAAPYLRFLLVRNEEVVGSNPISSTKITNVSGRSNGLACSRTRRWYLRACVVAEPYF